ncbi:cell wall-binding repeat-containing protein [Ornithinimicrobium cerasi]|uniref:Peptidoglycan/xylan/chitin deacetylase, PgdA/CDA1 family n=1 Tax=Ornithinimicrobium cerasi TaxID=2248773 RepID=A0A285VX39_9MICO|nr:cell wall-binding repeat-containing protein [Ornithinimicrobium cerasi]SOC58158.1 Peptidoglycan/xylan/chitin deacetylase, PgdA/CDA1 family [Ornithinimicrobium cerasi]
MGLRRGVVVVVAAVAAALSTAAVPPPTATAPSSVVADSSATPVTADRVASATLAQATISGPPWSRLAGSDRYGSAVAISRHRYADPAAARVVYLTRGDTFADALAAGTLTDGPVLLTRPSCGALPTVVRTEIERLDPDAVVALGGTLAVCDAVLTDAAAGRPTQRIGGATRQDTAALIAARAFPGGAGTAYLTSGAITPDAVVGGMLRDGPILLTSSNGSSVPQVTIDAVAATGATRVIALGGSLAVPDAVLAQAAAGRTTSRLAGADRYATAAAIARHAYPSRTTRVYLARGDGLNFVDAVASGMLTDGPVVLTSGPCDKVRTGTAGFLKQRYPGQLVALGGTAALCDSTMRGASLAARQAINCGVTKCVALTYDDGPSTPTPTLLNTLAQQRVPATFFVVGAQVDAYPAHARRTYVEGHEVANHTWNHPDLRTLTLSAQQTQTVRTDNELNQHGIPDTQLLRPPYGAYDSNTRRLGFPLILWDVDPRDWDGPPSPATTRARVVGATTNGSIVLMHDIHNNTVLAAPGIIADLKAQGYTFVTVSELIPGLDDGDLVYRRGRVTPAGTAASPSDVIVTEDGTVLGPVVDEAGIPDLAPMLSREALLPDGR